MKVFIFGAGASQGSQDPNTPTYEKAPLVDEIFDPPYERYANELGISLPDLQEYRDALKSGSSLEDMLTDKWLAIEKYKEPSRQFSERKSFGRFAFYLWRLFQRVSATYNGNNWYAIFIDKLNKKDIPYGLISFNYDTLLDRAVTDVIGYPLMGNLETYIERRLIKPHGSVNWFLPKRQEDKVISGEQSHDIKVRYNIASSLMFNGSPLLMVKMQVMDPGHSDLNRLDFITNSVFDKQYFYPLIFMPLFIKQYHFIQNFYGRVISEGKKLMAQADEIFLIGYRASDEIIKEDMFSVVKPNTRLNVISRNDADKIADDVLKWKPDLFKNLIFPHGFAEFVKIFDSYDFTS